MKEILIEHDNGVKGRRGVTEYEINSYSDIETILKGYDDLGVIVYKIIF